MAAPPDVAGTICSPGLAKDLLLLVQGLWLQLQLLEVLL